MRGLTRNHRISYLHTAGWAIRLIVSLNRNNIQKSRVVEPEMEYGGRTPSLPRHHVSMHVGGPHDGASSTSRPELGGAMRSELDAPPSECGGAVSELAGDDIEPVSSTTGGGVSQTGSPPPYPDRVPGALLGDKKQRFGNNR